MLILPVNEKYRTFHLKLFEAFQTYSKSKSNLLLAMFLAAKNFTRSPWTIMCHVLGIWQETNVNGELINIYFDDDSVIITEAPRICKE